MENDKNKKELYINMPDCVLQGSGGLEIKIRSGIYKLTNANDLNKFDAKLSNEDGSVVVTVDARMSSDGKTVEIS